MKNSPDAIGIGCQRCASSFLHDCLNKHPEIEKPHRGLHFFSKYPDYGNDWYFSNLPEKKKKKNIRIFGFIHIP